MFICVLAAPTNNKRRMSTSLPTTGSPSQEAPPVKTASWRPQKVVFQGQHTDVSVNMLRGVQLERPATAGGHTSNFLQVLNVSSLLSKIFLQFTRRRRQTRGTLLSLITNIFAVIMTARAGVRFCLTFMNSFKHHSNLMQRRLISCYQ